MARGRLKWTRARILETIRRYRDRRRSLAWSRVPHGLTQGAVREFGSYRAAIEAAGLDYRTVSRKVGRYSDDELLEWLRGVARKQPDMTLVKLTREKQFGVVRDRFGSWQKAVARAGLRNWPAMHETRWSKAAVVEAIREVVKRGGFISQDKNLYAAARRYFGSAAAAAKAAKVEFHAPRNWTRDEVIRELRAIARRHGRVTNPLAHDAHIRAAIEKHFGGMAAACEAAGGVGFHEQLRREHAVGDDCGELIARLRAVAAKLDRPVRAKDLPSSLSGDSAAVRDSARARDAARLPHSPGKRRRWTTEIIATELRHEHRRGTRLTRKGLVDAGRYDLVGAIIKYLGSIVRARRLARLPEPRALPLTFMPFSKVWDEDRVAEDIQAIAREGLPLATSKVPPRLVAAARAYWGTYRAAVEAAGFEYNAVLLCPHFEDDELLERLRTIADRNPTMTLGELREHRSPTSSTRGSVGSSALPRRSGATGGRRGLRGPS